MIGSNVTSVIFKGGKMAMIDGVYINHCWDKHCSGEINSLFCPFAGYDNTGGMGYECPVCGKHLGHQRDPQNHTPFEVSNHHDMLHTMEIAESVG